MVQLRVATAADAEELRAIYAPYVEKTAISFEYETPDAAQMRRRIESTLEKHPYLVAQAEGEILGYAYATAFKARKAYAHAVETTVYVRRDQRRTGIGRRLYTALEQLCRAQGILNLNACIAYTEREDEYLTQGSPAFHGRMGYETVGTFHRCGYKFGRWYDMVWMEKLIGIHSADAREVIPFPELDAETVQKCLK